MTPPKRMGRPYLDPRSPGPSVEHHLRLPPELSRKAEQAAAARRESIQDLIRRELSRVLNADRG